MHGENWQAFCTGVCSELKGFKMDNGKKVKILSWLMFLMSCVLSMSLGLVMYVLRTDGQLPFDLPGNIDFRDETYQAPKKEMKAAKIPYTTGSIDEVTLRTLDGQLRRQQEILQKKEKDIDEKQAVFEQMQVANEQAKKIIDEKLKELEEKSIAQEKKFKENQKILQDERIALQKKIEGTDTDVVKRIASTLAVMKADTAMQLVYDLDLHEASRLLDEMEEVNRSAILSKMIESAGPLKNAYRKKANELIVELRKLKK